MDLIKKSKLWVITVFLLALLLAIFFERCYSASRLFKAAYYEMKDRQNQQMVIEDFSVLCYEVQGNQLSVTSDKSNQLLYGEINRKVGTITIYFAQPLQQDISSSLYYTVNDKDFNEGIRIRAISRQGDMTLTFCVSSTVQKIRLDIGEQAGDQFYLSKVCINESWRSIKELIRGTVQPLALSRSSLFFIVLLFVGLHFLFDIKKMYKVLFQYRYAAALGLLLLLALQQYHGSSIGMYDSLIQPSLGSDYVTPVLGHVRAIRSDEWAVSTPWKLASAYGDHPFGKYNEIMRATQTVNLGTSGLYFSWASLTNPFSFFIYIFGIAGYGAYWYSVLIACFMVSFEICLILCRRQRLFALMGACLITFSAYFQWWSYVMWIVYGEALLVFIYYYITTNKAWKRALLAAGIGCSGAAYVSVLYPAWLVPASYLLMGIFIWIIVSQRDTIKKFKWKDWSLFSLGIIFGLTILLHYYISDKDYLDAIMQTAYPGKRFSQGGGALHLIFNYFKTPLYPYLASVNPSESGTFISLFPVAMIMGLYIWFRSKKKDLLLTIFLAYSIFLTVYVTVGLPVFLARVTLMSYSTASRALNILDYLQVLLLLIIMTRYESIPRFKPIFGAAFSIGATTVAIWYSFHHEPGYIPLWYLFVAGLIFSFICYCVMSPVPARIRSAGCYILIGISLITGLTVNPVQKGFDVIYSKPYAKAIMEIVQEDDSAKWIGVDQLVLPGFMISCGAPTINSVNNYPNMQLRKVLDPEGQYNEIYNRYAHIEISLTEEQTYPELVQADYVKLYLNYRDLNRIGVNYICVQHPLESNEQARFKLLYAESDCYIYKLE